MEKKEIIIWLGLLVFLFPIATALNDGWDIRPTNATTNITNVNNTYYNGTDWQFISPLYNISNNVSLNTSLLNITGGGNPFNQDLNTTDDVIFNSVNGGSYVYATNLNGNIVKANDVFDLGAGGYFRQSYTGGETPIYYNWLYPFDNGGGAYSMTTWVAIPNTEYEPAPNYQGGLQFWNTAFNTLFGGIDGVDGHLHWEMPVEFKNDLNVAGATTLDKLGLNGATADGNFLISNYNGATGSDYLMSFWDSTGGLYEQIYFEGGGIKTYTPNNLVYHAGTSTQINTDWSNIYLDAGQSGSYYWSQDEIRIGRVGKPKLNFVDFAGSGTYNTDMQTTDTETLMTNGDFIALKNLIAKGYSVAVPDANEILYYKFDETSGTDILDSSAVGVNGTATIWDANAYNRGGKIGEGIMFSIWLGASYVDSNQDAPFQFGSGNFALNIWAKDAVAGNDYFIGKGGTTGDYYGIGIDASNNAFFDIGGVRATLPTTLNRWHMITGVRDGNNIYVYVDGVASSPADVTGLNASPTGNNLIIGGRHPTEVALTTLSTLDEARVFNRSLSATEVADLYHSKLGNVEGFTGTCVNASYIKGLMVGCND